MPLPPTYKFRSISTLIGLYTKFGMDPIDDYIYFYNHERIQLKTGLAPLTLRQSC